MSKKDNVPKGVERELKDVDYWRKLSKKPSIPMPDGSLVSQYDWMNKFMKEYYGNDFYNAPKGQQILTTKEQQKDAIRNNNNLKRDAFLVSGKAGMLYFTPNIERVNIDEIKEPWEKEFVYGDTSVAQDKLFRQSCEDLNIEFTETNIIRLIMIFKRIKKYLRLVRRDQRTQNEQK